MKKAKKNRSKFVILIRWLCSISIIAVLLWVIYIFAGRLLCQIALGQIGELTNTSIKAGSIKYMSNGSVVFEDLVVKPCKSQTSNCEIIKAKRLFASFDKKSLFLFKPTLNLIDVNDFVFNVVYNVDTNWSNLSNLKMKHKGGGLKKTPDIHLGSGTFQYVKIVNGQEEIALSVPVDADFESNNDVDKMYRFNITTATMSSGYGLSRLQGFWKPGQVIVTGGVSSLSVSEFEMAWFINVSAAEFKYDNDNNFSLALTIKDMQSLRSNEPNVLDVGIPPFAEHYGFISALQKFLDDYKPKGLMDINLKMSGNLNEIADSTIKGAVHCRDVTFLYSRFPYEIKHLVGKIDFTQDSVAFDNLAGKHGDSELIFSGWSKNFGKNRELKINIKSDSMLLEEDLYNALNESQQEFWSSFDPKGRISLDMQIEKNKDIGKVTNANIGLLNVNAIYDNFPYPLKNLSGELVFSPGEIAIKNAFSRDSDIDILINGEIFGLNNEDPSFDLVIDVNNIPMNPVLENALQGGQKKLYQNFDPTGFTRGSITVSKSQSDDINYSADMNFWDTSIHTDFLEEPLTDIFANVILSQDTAIVKKLSGNYGDMPVLLTGSFMSEQEEQLCYDVSLDLKRVQLGDKELQNLLPESIKTTVERFDPNGMTDMIIDLKKLDPEKTVNYDVIVNCLGNSLYLEDFNYAIKDVTGLMVIDSNNMKLKGVEACLVNDVNDETVQQKLFLDGDIRIDNGIMKQAELSLSAKNILLNEKFIKLFSPKSEGLSQALLSGGTIDIDFEKFNMTNNYDGNKTVDFNGVINLDNYDFVISNRLAKLNSLVLVQGKYTSGKGLEYCDILINDGSLNVFDKNLNDIKTKIIYDPNQRKWSSQYLLADLYGGQTFGQIELTQEEDVPTECVLQIAFENVDLKRFLSDTNNTEEVNTNYSSGKMSGSISLSSQIPQKNSQIGSCRVSVKNMQVGKMSPITQLLQVMKLNEPSEYAFDSMFIDSYIKRDNLIVDKLDLSGKSVAFYGSGSISLLDGGMDLSLIARGQRHATDDPKLFQSLTEGLGKAVIRMDVKGSYNNIIVETKPLPVIEGTLQILGKPVLNK